MTVARRVVELATGEELFVAKTDSPPEKNPAAVALGRMGGLKGGKARAASLSAGRRKSIAMKAAKARWKNARRSSA